MSRICGRCGNVCDDRAAFCEHCGMPLDTLPLNEPTARNPRIYNDNFTRQPVEPSRSPQPPQSSFQPPRNTPENLITPQPKKSNTGMIIAIVATAGGVVLILLIILLILLMPSCNKKNAPQPVATSSVVQTQPVTYAAPTTKKPYYAVPNNNPMPTNGNKYRPEFDTTEEPSTEEPTDATEPTEAPSDYTSVEEPTDDDFSGWFLRATGSGAPPSGAETMSGGDEVSGAWKALFYYTDTNVMEYKKANVSAGDRAATVNLIHCRVKVNGEYHYDSTPDSVLEGAINGGELAAYSQSGKLTITTFYRYEGKQYAIGTFVNPSGETAQVGFVRP